MCKHMSSYQETKVNANYRHGLLLHTCWLMPLRKSGAGKNKLFIGILFEKFFIIFFLILNNYRNER